MSISDFLKSDTEKLENLITEYPTQLPVPIVAKFLGVDPNNLRQAITENQLGFSWQKVGKLNKGFCIPTGKFVRWYLEL